jgi:hypothetical protein
MKVNDYLTLYLSGNNNVPDAVKSWARIFIYKKACEVLQLPKPERAAVIDAYGQPELLRAEVVRVYKMNNR